MEGSNDPRFSAMATAPMFTKFKKDNFKTKVDSRFSSVLKDEKFIGQGKTDIYGRKQNKKAARKEMESLYMEDNPEVGEPPRAGKGKSKSTPNNAPGDSKDARLEYLNKVARGEIAVNSGSDSDDSDSGSDSDSSGGSSAEDSESEEEEEDGVAESALAIPDVGDEQDGEFYEEDEVATSNRVAVKNCDWESVTAKDMLAIMQSFCPTGSTVKEVTVYFSDFGMERMAREAESGPQGLWLEDAAGSDDDDEEDEDEDEDEDDEFGSEDEEEVEEEEEEEGGKGKNFKGDIKRGRGQVGIVWENEEEEEEQDASGSDSDSGSDAEGDDSPAEYQGERNAFGKKGKNYSGSRTWQKPSKAGGDGPKRVVKKKVDSDYNTVALRKYELSKLKYYFAIAVCDSSATADYLCEHIDGLEYHSSSMAFDLSLVPDEIDFTERKVKDKCSELTINEYRPPSDFTVNALQHTNVECSWDAGEKQREKKLTQIFQWRKLQDSDFQQYIASSDSEDEEADAEDSERAAKAKQFRKALLGGDSDSDVSEDDFFVTEKPSSSSAPVEDEDQCKSFSYVPEESEDEEAKPTSKRAKKEAKRALKAKQEQEERAAEAERQKKSSLALLLADDMADGVDAPSKHEYDMHSIRKAEKKKDRKEGKRSNAQQKVEGGEAGSFEIDTADSRFSSLVNSNKFAIDPTSAEYKSTPAMKKLLQEQQERLIQQQIEEDKNGGKRRSEQADLDDEENKGKKLKTSDTSALVDKVRQKFAKNIKPKSNKK